MSAARRRAACVAVAGAALLLLLPAGAAFGAGRPPRLERFVARFNPQTSTTVYISVATDPDGGKLTYQWSLRAECGFLADPRATGPSNGYQFGAAARPPDGCTREEQQAARITVRIVDQEGCAIVYTQAARNETEHVRPAVRTLACPPVAGSEERGTPGSGGVPVVAIALVVAGVLGGFAVLRARARTSAPVPDAAPWEEEPASATARWEDAEEQSEWAPAPPRQAAALPTVRAPQPAHPGPVEPRGAYADLETLDVEPVDDDLDERYEPVVVAHAPAPAAAEPPCEEGSVRGEGRDLVAHDTVLAGAVRAAVRDGADVEVPPGNAREIVRLADLLGVQTPLEVEVEIPLRLVTIVSSRREVCRGGRWTLDVKSTTHDGPERVERLRAIVSTAEELERFADQILARRLRTLTDARRRLESSLATMRDRG